MGENSAIEWTDHTFNPWIGCTNVSPGCDNCYAERRVRQLGQPELWEGHRRRTSLQNWHKPLRWNRHANQNGVRHKVFCASWADVFDNQVDVAWRNDLWQLIAACPDLDWLLLTKRPQNMPHMLPPNWGQGWRHVWLGVTAENQREAERRIPILCNLPARKRFLSCEPLLGPIDLNRLQSNRPLEPGAVELTSNSCLTGRTFNAQTGLVDGMRAVDWVIAGGESGREARPPHPAWFRSLRDQCAIVGVPFFFKQWGDWREYDHGSVDYSVDALSEQSWQLLQQATRPGFISEAGEFFRFQEELPETGAFRLMEQVGKHIAGATLDGRTHKEFPA